MKIIDLTHTFDATMPVFPGDEPVELVKNEVAGPGGVIMNHTMKSSMHVGTHMDGPAHMISDGRYLFEMQPKKFTGRGVFIDVRGRKEVHAEMLDTIELRAGDCICICTGASVRFREPNYFDDIPSISPGFCQRLADAKVSMVILDFCSPDAPPYPLHKILLCAEVLIVENACNLELLDVVKEFEIIALPLKIKADSAPVRLIARY